jgi:hypothetical protein
MSASTLASPAVSGFAAAVRAALSDLSPDEIDDLTDGLEADLTDRIAESSSDWSDAALGDPVAYAEELRTAAGLPHRPTASRAGLGWAVLVDALRAAPREVAGAMKEFGSAHPSLGRIRDFFIAVRPLWWLFRAAVVTALVMNVLTPGWWMPINFLTAVVAIVALIVSVQFGRGKWLPFAWMRGLLLAGNVILVIVSPLIIAGITTAVNNGWSAASYVDSSNDLTGSGLLENGEQVTNIFAYDAQGKPLTDVQLFDQDGKPLDLSGDPTAAYAFGDDSSVVVPNDAVTGRPGWNVFPLDRVKQTAIGDVGTVTSSAHRIAPELPFAAARPLAGSETAPSGPGMPTPTPSPTPAP